MRPARLIAIPGGVLSGKRNSLWIALLALSPLAYFGATQLQGRLPQARPPVELTKDEVVARAVGFAATRGMDARGWSAIAHVQTHDTVRALLSRRQVPALQDVLAPDTILVTLRSPRPDEWLNVHLTPGGTVIEFLGPKPKKKGDAVDEARLRAAARQYVEQSLGPRHPFPLGEPAVRNVDRTGWQREFTWQSAIPGFAQGKISFHVTTAGDQVIAASRSLDLDDSIRKSLDPDRPWTIPLRILQVIYYIGLGIYAVYRYVRRSREKEISHWRTFLIAGIFAVGGVVLMMLNGEQFRPSPGEVPGAAMIVFLALVMTFGFGIVGLYFGVAYGAGEGDLREAYPGKLASLDAFLSGKPFSANFARSLLAGGAFAGWLLLLQNALLLLLRAGPPRNASGVSLLGANPYPLAYFIWDNSPDILVMLAFGLLQPLTVLRSHIRKNWIVYSIFLPLCAMVAWGVIPSRDTWQDGVIFECVFVAAVCVPFFLGDLVASVSSLLAVEYIGQIIRSSAHSAEWHAIAYQEVLPAAAIFLAVELYFAWRGRVYDEEEVRPRYARNLAQRLSLTAEIGAARLAQLRLLPDAPPRIAGLSIAGACVPAREVGGDFFDYYALDDHRLGVFLAEGGNRELGSAMAIALAKGFLMYTARLELAPVEILRRLRATLASVLGGEDAPMTVLYAVIDGRNGSVRYARSGEWPRLAINGQPLAEEIVADRADSFIIRHGAATLAPLDAIFFYTDGWARQILGRTRKPPDEFIVHTSRKLGDVPAAELHQALIHAALRRKDAPPDDVTAVMVRRDVEEKQEAIGGIA